LNYPRYAGWAKEGMVTTAAKQVAAKGRHLTHFGCTNDELFLRHVSRRSMLEPRSYL
jgi:hypothetical protein